MRILALTALALGFACVLVVGAASATAQEAGGTLDELLSAGIPLINNPRRRSNSRSHPFRPNRAC
jgi:hypothetical protein